MNFPEKLVGAYLRLNGFFLLPQFTIFERSHHTHVDFLALKPPGGVEQILVGDNSLTLLVDEAFFDCISELVEPDARNSLLGGVVEVRGNRTVDIPDEADLQYARRFFGDHVHVIPMSFSLRFEGIGTHEDAVAVGLEHAAHWVIERFEWMDEELPRLRKEESWSMSDDVLSDLISVKKLLLRSARG